MKSHIRGSIFILVICALLDIFGLPAAGRVSRLALSQEKGDEFYYFSDGQKITLIPSADYVAVRFFQSSATGRLAMSHPEIDETSPQETDLPNRLCRLKLKAPLDRNSVRNVMSRLSSDPNVELVAPVFATRDADLIVTDEFIARFAASIGQSAIATLNRRHAVEVVEKVGWSDNTYILRVAKGHALATANAYSFLPEVVFAHPNFVRILKDAARTGQGPNSRVIWGPDGQLLPPDTPIQKGRSDYLVREPVALWEPDALTRDSQLSANAAVTRVTGKTEDFEGAFPNDWVLSGSPTWGVQTYRKYQGSRAAYCVGSTVNPPGPYPDSVTARMSYGPFSLADAVAARVSMRVWFHTEVKFDYFSYYASIDNQNYYGAGWSGNSENLNPGGWIHLSFDLAHVPTLGDLRGQPNVWIRLRFLSDATFTYEGVYVDQIVIEKITGTGGYENITSDPYSNLQWHLRNNGQSWGTPGADIKAVEAWGVGRGSSDITIAIIDQGVDIGHPDLAGKMVPGYDATGRGSGGGPDGNDAHGTNCAGIAAAITDNGQGIAGVAPLAKIMPVRIAYSDANGKTIATDAWIADGLTWAVTNHADVLSCSWEVGSPSSSITSAINFAKSNGRGGLGSVVVFAAGNDNGPVSYPAALSNVLAVGALGPCDARKSPDSCDGEEWWGSNYGPELDVSAPGVNMYSTDIHGTAGYDRGDYFYNFNGTSSAAPVVAGVAALVLGSRPNLTAFEVENMLKNTADDLGTPGRDDNTGYGRVNAFRALQGIVSRILWDMNGDGKADILWHHKISGQVYLYLMNGSTILSSVLVTTVADPGWEIVGRGDYDGDGKADILWKYKPSGDIYLYFMDGPKIVSAAVVGKVADTAMEIVGTGDFDGDRKADILWRHKSSGDIYLYLMNGATIRSVTLVGTVADPSWEIVGTGDYNGDGKADLLWYYKPSGQVYLYLMNGATVLSAALLTAVADPAWEIVGTGDYNGDGKADILWRYKYTGDVYLYLMNGATILSATPAAAVADPAWGIVGTGDYNGDGKADILWRYKYTGDVYLYLMNGASVTWAGGIATMGDSNWVVVRAP